MGLLIFTIYIFAIQTCLAWDIGLQVDYLHYDTHHFWNKKGDRKRAHNHFQLQEGNAWVLLSPGPDDLITLYSYWDEIHESLNGKVSGLGDFELSWTHRLRGGLFVQGIAIIPSGKEKASLRYGRFGGEGSLLYVLPIPKGLIYSRLGYRFYTGGPSDQCRAEGGLTYCLFQRLQATASGILEYGLFNGHRTLHPNAIFFNPNYRLFRLDFQLNGSIFDFLSLNVGAFRHLWGENMGTGGGFFGGLTLSY